MPRLLQCNDCITLDKLPDFSGRPEDDVLLEDLIQRKHTFPDGNPHRGNMHVVDQETYDKLGGETKIQEELQRQTNEFYATRDTYAEDALACYHRHFPTQKNVEGCSDYRADSKRIGNPTKEGWERGPKVYLCFFCPIQSIVTTQARKKKGMYR